MMLLALWLAVSAVSAQEKVIGGIEFLSVGISKFFGGTMSSNPVLNGKIMYVNSGFVLGLERSSDLLDAKTLSNSWSFTSSWGSVCKGVQYTILLFSYCWDTNNKMKLLAPALSLSKQFGRTTFAVLGGYGFNEMSNLSAIQSSVVSSYFGFGQKVQVSFLDWKDSSWSVLLEANKQVGHVKVSLYYGIKWADVRNSAVRSSASAIGISYSF